MPLPLPTDTTHLRQPQRQYELFNQPLGQGIARRTLAIGAASALMWIPFAWLCLGITVFEPLGPLLLIAPPSAFTILGQLPDGLGRWKLLAWFDRAATLLPARRARMLLGNPYLPEATRPPGVLRLHMVCELYPGDAVDLATATPPPRRARRASRRAAR